MTQPTSPRKNFYKFAMEAKKLKANEIVSTNLGNFMKYHFDPQTALGRAPWVWQCPHCEQWFALTLKQFLGGEPFSHDGFSTQHDFSLALNEALAA